MYQCQACNPLSEVLSQGHLGNKLLDREQERHTLATRELHGDSGVVHAVLLYKVDVSAAINVELAADLHPPDTPLLTEVVESGC